MSSWKKLGPGWAEALDDSGVEDDMGVDWLIALGSEARLREAARSLALEEHLLGTYVDEEEPVMQQLRFAAKDSADSTDALYVDGKVKVSGRIEGTTLVLVQQAGPPGITVVFGEQWVPLQPGVPSPVDGWSSLPESLSVLDRKGRRRVLHTEN